MKIQFRKKHFIYFLVLGLLWLILGSALRILEPEHLYSYGYIVMGAIHIGVYIFMKNKQYLSIRDGVLTKNNFSPKRINLTEIITVKKFAGDYILKSKHEELTINTHLIDKKSLAELDNELGKLNVDWI